MIEINPQRIRGRWLNGFALDFHTISSTPIGENAYGHMQFDTVRPPVAELLYNLKYRGDVTVIGEIAAVAADFLKRQRRPIDIIVPAPPSAARRVQPVVLLAKSIGAALNIPVAGCVTTTRATSQLKNITDPAERAEALAGLYAVDVQQTKGKAVLLFDDLYRSGSTLNAITSLLLADGSAAQVDVLTITRTRSNQ
jgi:predicted amidophosphoribosyltransferase